MTHLPRGSGVDVGGDGLVEDEAAVEALLDAVAVLLLLVTCEEERKIRYGREGIRPSTTRQKSAMKSKVSQYGTESSGKERGRTNLDMTVDVVLLEALDRVTNGDTREVRIGAEAFPAAGEGESARIGTGREGEKGRTCDHRRR